MAGPVQVEVPVPFGIRSVNAWLWPGAEPALVDCGLGTDEAYTLLRTAMRRHGIGDGARLYITHGHVDHAGNAARLRRDMGIPLQAHAQESPFVETFRRDSVHRNDRFAQALRLHGMPDEAVAAIRRSGEDIDRFLEDCPIATHIVEGQRIVLGETEARVEHAPGHTPGSLLIATEDNHLLSGDTLLRSITSNAIALLPEDELRQHQYVRTLEGLHRHLGRTVLPGHHAPFELTQEVLDHHLDRHHRRAARILESLDRACSAYDLLARIFPHVRADASFLAMADLVGHLHALEQQGRVVRREEGAIRRFVRA